MDKSAIRNFAIEARKILMKSAETEAGFYGVTKMAAKVQFRRAMTLKCMRRLQEQRIVSMVQI